MKWRRLLCSLFALFFLSVTLVYSSGQGVTPAAAPDQAVPKPPKPQFFAGQVVESDTVHVKVSRNLVGRPLETRVFVLDAKTKTPKGGVKLKSRVTVRYEHLPEHDLALEIQVRPLSHTPKSS